MNFALDRNCLSACFDSCKPGNTVVSLNDANEIRVVVGERSTVVFDKDSDSGEVLAEGVVQHRPI